MKRIVLSVCAAVAFVTVAMGAAFEYQQVEYLGLTGKQYFTVPFNRTSKDLGYCVKFRMNSHGSSESGPHIISRSDHTKYCVVCRGDGIWLLYENGAMFSCSKDCYPGNLGVGIDMTMAFNTNGDQKAWINGSNVATRASIPAPVSFTEMRFCHYKGDLTLNGRFYGVQLYTNGVMIANYRPSRRLSDDMLGLYETFTDTFHENKGTETSKIGAGPDVDVRSDVLVVTASPGVTYGASDPTYGAYDGMSAGRQRDLTAAGAVTNAAGTQRDAIVGWKLYRRVSPTDAAGSWTQTDEGVGGVCHYRHPEPENLMKVVWNWNRENNVTAVGTNGVKVSPEVQWAVEGGSVSIGAEMASRKWSVKWGGDVPRANVFDNPLIVTAENPKRITSELIGRGYSYMPYLTTSWVTIATGVKSLEGYQISAIIGGGYIGGNVVRDQVWYRETEQTADGTIYRFQAQVLGAQLKCVIVELLLTNGGELRVRAKEACYNASPLKEGSFNFYGSPAGKTSQALATSDSANGYGVKSLLIYTAPPKRMGLYLMLK